MIQVNSGPHDFQKLVKSAATDRKTRFIRGEIARDYVWRTGNERAEISSAPKINILINDLRRVSLKIRITSGGVFGGRTGGMAIVAAGHGIHQVASEPNQAQILACQTQRHGSNLEAAPNSAPVIVGSTVIGTHDTRGRPRREQCHGRARN